MNGRRRTASLVGAVVLTASSLLVGMVGPADAATTATLGIAGDVPLPGRYLGGDRDALAVFRPSNLTFYVLASGKTTAVNLGVTTAIGWRQLAPAPADYDGDGRTDFAYFYNSGGGPGSGGVKGNFRIRYSSTGAIKTVRTSSGQPAPADYDGDGRAEVGAFSNGGWAWIDRNGTSHYATLGKAGDIPLPMENDGFIGDDYVVYRPSTSQWLTLGSSSVGKTTTVALGKPGDVPVRFKDCYGPRPAVYRQGSGSGTWLVQGVAPVTLTGLPATQVPAPADLIGWVGDDYVTFRNGVWTYSEARLSCPN